MRGHDDLAADVVWNAVLAAEVNHGRGSGDAEAGLQGSGLVIDAGVNDAAVVSALVASDTVFFLEEQEPQVGKTARDFERDAKADGATADDDHVVARVGH